MLGPLMRYVMFLARSSSRTLPVGAAVGSVFRQGNPCPMKGKYTHDKDVIVQTYETKTLLL